MLPVHAHDFRLHALRIRLVPLLNLRELWLYATHLHARPHGFLIQRPEQKPDSNSEDDEHPAITEIQRCAHPEKDTHDDRRKWLHDALQEATVRVRVFELAAKCEKATPFLRTCVELERKGAVSEWLDRNS